MDPLDLLERTLQEIDALEAIYGLEEDDGSSFSVLSFDALATSQLLVEQGSSSLDSSNIPHLRIEIKLRENDTTSCTTKTMSLRCTFPPGYPELAPLSLSIMVSDLNRSAREALCKKLQDHAKDLMGQEAVMSVVDFFRESAIDFWKQQHVRDSANDQMQDLGESHLQQKSYYGRRWIWVHHITNSDRRKSIISEATSLRLAGFLKYGYPGAIVVEGPTQECDVFVGWIKGNKSRPGGFGRNWGHHVRGHVDFEDKEERKFLNEFRELEDLSALGSECRERGVEEEFLEFVLQHRGSEE